MRPLHVLAVGIVLIVVDFRTTALDLLPDVLGWALVGIAVHQVVGRRAAALAALGGVLSLSTLALPYHRVQINPFTGEEVVVSGDTDLGYAELVRYDGLAGGRLLAAAAALIVLVVLGAWTIRVVTARAMARGAARAARSVRVGAVATVVLWVVPQLVGMAVGATGADGYDPVWDDPVGRIELLGIVAALALAAMVAREGREPWALRPGAERLLPSMRSATRSG